MSGKSFRERTGNLAYALRGTFLKLWARLDGVIETRFGDGSKDAALAQAFKSDAEALEDAPVPLSAHIALYTVLTLLVIAILWSIFGLVDRIVVAPGKIATRTPMIVMQPYTTSRIQQIHVQPGDHVLKGQVLVSFDPAFAQADVASLGHKVRSRSAEVARIEAQLAGQSFAVGATGDAEQKTQQQIFDQESATYAAELAQRDSRVSALDAQIHATQAGILAYQTQLGMANKVVGIYQGLVDQKAGAPLDLMKAQSSAIDVQTRLTNAMADLKKLTDQRSEAQSEKRAFLDKWRSDHNQDLVKARQDLTEAVETLNKADKIKDFAEVRAPADAVVLEIADRSVGSVLREAETLLTLVPDNADLYVEANVNSRDISHLKIGSPVRVKLEAYPFQKYGTLNGQLDVISADSVALKEDEHERRVYHARVRLLETPRELARRGFLIRPGMVISAEIKTGRRSIASYIMNPILRTADESLSEP
ncbi:MAG: HlyD family type I secretion periplasmic adaptor subunit [Rhizomicrobium sp.]|nr:HlyD family type I secretion periplasmic adaptor subunit [Rhizomicrobium sp.]